MKMTLRQIVDRTAVRGLQQEGQDMLDIERIGGELSMQFMTGVRANDVHQMTAGFPDTNMEDSIYAGAEECPRPCNYRAQSLRLDLGCPEVAKEIEQSFRPQMG